MSVDKWNSPQQTPEERAHIAQSVLNIIFNGIEELEETAVAESFRKIDQKTGNVNRSLFARVVHDLHSENGVVNFIYTEGNPEAPMFSMTSLHDEGMPRPAVFIVGNVSSEEIKPIKANGDVDVKVKAVMGIVEVIAGVGSQLHQYEQQGISPITRQELAGASGNQSVS